MDARQYARCMKVYEVCLDEIATQIQTHCAPLGEMTQQWWESVSGLISTLIQKNDFLERKIISMEKRRERENGAFRVKEEELASKISLLQRRLESADSTNKMLKAEVDTTTAMHEMEILQRESREDLVHKYIHGIDRSRPGDDGLERAKEGRENVKTSSAESLGDCSKLSTALETVNKEWKLQKARLHDIDQLVTRLGIAVSAGKVDVAVDEDFELEESKSDRDGEMEQGVRGSTRGAKDLGSSRKSVSMFDRARQYLEGTQGAILGSTNRSIALQIGDSRLRRHHTLIRAPNAAAKHDLRDSTDLKKDTRLQWLLRCLMEKECEMADHDGDIEALVVPPEPGDIDIKILPRQLQQCVKIGNLRSRQWTMLSEQQLQGIIFELYLDYMSAKKRPAKSSKRTTMMAGVGSRSAAGNRGKGLDRATSFETRIRSRKNSAPALGEVVELNREQSRSLISFVCDHLSHKLNLRSMGEWHAAQLVLNVMNRAIALRNASSLSASEHGLLCFSRLLGIWERDALPSMALEFVLDGIRHVMRLDKRITRKALIESDNGCKTSVKLGHSVTEALLQKRFGCTSKEIKEVVGPISAGPDGVDMNMLIKHFIYSWEKVQAVRVSQLRSRIEEARRSNAARAKREIIEANRKERLRRVTAENSQNEEKKASAEDDGRDSSDKDASAADPESDSDADSLGNFDLDLNDEQSLLDEREDTIDALELGLTPWQHIYAVLQTALSLDNVKNVDEDAVYKCLNLLDKLAKSTEYWSALKAAEVADTARARAVSKVLTSARRGPGRPRRRQGRKKDGHGDGDGEGNNTWKSFSAADLDDMIERRHLSPGVDSQTLTRAVAQFSLGLKKN
eukprot:g1424.t1